MDVGVREGAELGRMGEVACGEVWEKMVGVVLSYLFVVGDVLKYKDDGFFSYMSRHL